MAKKLKDLGGKNWEKYSSISAAQEAGSIYYSKNNKKMAAVKASDLGKGQSLRSFMNEQLKGGANYKVKGIGKVRPKLRPKSGRMKPVVDPKGQDVGKDTTSFPEKIDGISRADMLKIIDGSKPKIVRSSETKAQRVKRISAQGAGVTTVAGLRAILKDAGAKPARIAETLKDPVILKRLEKQKTIQDSAIAQERGGRESAMIKRPANKSEVILESFSAVKPKRKVIPTKKRIISNAAVRKFMRKEFPGRLSNIEIGDTVFFRTNAAGDPVVSSILKKVK